MPGRFLPRKATSPAGQKQHVSFGQRALAVTPRHFFDDDRSAAMAIHAPHSVKEEDEKSPQRNELEAPLGELVIAGCWLMAAGTDRSGALARPYRNLDTFLVWTEPGVVVDKFPKAVAAVQNRDQFHSRVRQRWRKLHHKPCHAELDLPPRKPASVASTTEAFEYPAIPHAPWRLVDARNRRRTLGET